MATTVWFIGHSGSRTITKPEWGTYGITANTVTWSGRNGWAVDQSKFSTQQLNYLKAQKGEFLLNQNGPRRGPPPLSIPSQYKSNYAYYLATKAIKDGLAPGSGGGEYPLASQRGVYYVDAYENADPTGATNSDSAVQAAIADLGDKPGIIDFGVGMYTLTQTAELAYHGQYFRMQGVGLTSIRSLIDGPTLKIWDSTTDPSGNHASGRGGGILGGCSIWGIENEYPGACGIMIGDIIEAKIDHCRVNGFIGENQIGALLHNRYGWTEYCTFDILADYNTNNFVIEAHPDHPKPYGGGTSFSYNTFNFGFSAEANQNGVWIRGGVIAIGLRWNMQFNCNPGDTNTGVAFMLGSDYDITLEPDPVTGRINNDAYEYNHIQAEMNFVGETTNAGSVCHTDLMMGPKSSWRGSGAFIFNDFAGDGFLPGNVKPYEYRFVFSGRVDSASMGYYARFENQFTTIGDCGRFAASGNNGRSIQFQENAWGGYPVIGPRVARSELTWDPINKENIEDDVSIGLVLKSRLSTTEERKSLITIDGVNVVETLDGLGVQCKWDGLAPRDNGEYTRLATLPADKAPSIQIIGRFGGFEKTKTAFWRILLHTSGYDGDTPTWDVVEALISVDGDVWSTSGIWECMDLVAYLQEDGSTILYLKMNGWFLYNFIVTANFATIDWDQALLTEQKWGEEPDTEPTGELSWTLSQEPRFNRTLTQDIVAKTKYVDDFYAGNGGVLIQGGLPADTLNVWYGATVFGGSNEIFFGGKRLQAIAAPSDWFDAVNFGTLELHPFPSYPTSGRPPASSLGVGGRIYDTNLHKPLWSDGTNWRDAAGTIV